MQEAGTWYQLQKYCYSADGYSIILYIHMRLWHTTDSTVITAPVGVMKYLTIRSRKLLSPIECQQIYSLRGGEAKKLVKKIGDLLKKATGEKRSTSFLCCSAEGNAASILNKFILVRQYFILSTF